MTTSTLPGSNREQVARELVELLTPTARSRTPPPASVRRERPPAADGLRKFVDNWLLGSLCFVLVPGHDLGDHDTSTATVGPSLWKSTTIG